MYKKKYTTMNTMHTIYEAKLKVLKRSRVKRVPTENPNKLYCSSLQKYASKKKWNETLKG